MKKIINMYKKNNIGRNTICQSCRKDVCEKNEFMSEPLSIWHVGQKYFESDVRILFVGKPHRGEPYNSEENSDFPNLNNQLLETEDYILGIAENLAAELFYNSGWAYWEYTKQILGKIFDSVDEGWKKVAITNLIKCTNTKTEDKTEEIMKKNCIEKLGIVWKEIDILKPTNVVLYLGPDYDEFIENKMLKKFLNINKIEEVYNKDHFINIGNKKCRCWERNLLLNCGKEINLLRISHPQFMNKKEYINEIKKWVENNQ